MLGYDRPRLRQPCPDVNLHAGVKATIRRGAASQAGVPVALDSDPQLWAQPFPELPTGSWHRLLHSAGERATSRATPNPEGAARLGARRNRHLPRPAAQHRGRAGAARRHPGQQRRLSPRRRVPARRAFLRAGPCPDLRALCRDDRAGAARRPGDAQAPVRGRRGPARAGRRALSQPPRPGRGHHRQRGRVWPHHPRPRPQARADQGRRGRGQPRLRPRPARKRPRADRAGREGAVRARAGRRVARASSVPSRSC